MSHIFKKVVSQNFWTGLFDYGVKSDGVVSVDSQIGGVSNYNSIYTGGITHAFHCSSPGWGVTQQEITRLLLAASNETNFCLTGFKPFTAKTRQNVVWKSSTDDSEYITKFEEPMASSFVKINIEAKDNDEYTHEIKLAHSDDMTTIMAFAILSEDEMVADYDKNIMCFDLKNYSGEITFYSIGRTNYNALLLDSVVVNLTNNQTSIHSENNHNEKVHVSREADALVVSLPSSMIGSAWQLYSVDGSLVSTGIATTTRLYLKNRRRGTYVLKIEKDDDTYVYKVLIP